MYEDRQLPFLDPDREENHIIIKNIIDGDMDDDCQTDDDQRIDALSMMKNELHKAISTYL